MFAEHYRSSGPAFSYSAMRLAHTAPIVQWRGISSMGGAMQRHPASGGDCSKSWRGVSLFLSLRKVLLLTVLPAAPTPLYSWASPISCPALYQRQNAGIVPLPLGYACFLQQVLQRRLRVTCQPASADVLHQDLPWDGTLPQAAPSSREACRRVHFCLSSSKSIDDGI